MWTSIVNAATGKTSRDANVLDGDVHKSISEFEQFYEDGQEEERKEKYATMVNYYYDLVTDFYEYGWGQSFHFAVRHDGETFNESILRHEFYLASQLGLERGMKVLDVGCGVGGPMRNIARFSGASITGLNNNAYQIKRATVLNESNKLDKLCSLVKGDFMNLPFEPNSFDAIYEIEATCHAPDKVKCFEQIFKVLKPGACFAGYEWCVTDNYDAKDPVQKDIIYWIEKGDGLPALVHTSEVVDALVKAGFEVVTSIDLADPEVCRAMGNSVPWYSSFQGALSLSQFKHTPVGRWTTQRFVDLLETIRVAPKGVGETHRVLAKTADALLQGGLLNIFTPMFFFLARKPVARS